MKAEILFIVWIVILVKLTLTTNEWRSTVVNNDDETNLLKKTQYTSNNYLKRAITTKLEAENFIILEKCMKSLREIQMQPLSTDNNTNNCCLTTICSQHGYLNNKNNKRQDNDDGTSEKYEKIKKLWFKLCSENTVYLFKEQLNGCCTKHSYKEKLTIQLTNCSNANFLPKPPINDEMEQINSRIAGDFKRIITDRSANSTKGGNKFSIWATAPTVASFKSGPNTTKTSNSLVIEDKKIRLENINETSSSNSVGLQFLDVPKGDDMRIYDLRIDKENYLLFEAFSTLMGYLLPTEFPTELLNDFFNKKLPAHVLFFQILKVEIVVVIWVLVWGTLAICLPVAIVLYLCCTSNIRHLHEDGSINLRDRCTENMLGFLLHVLLILLLCPIILIIAGNEQISRSIEKAPFTTSLLYEDINTFIRNTHMQISFVTTSSTDIAVEAIRKDLEDVRNLLGNPYQSELSSETGIDVALDALDELKIKTAQVTNLVTEILNECSAAQKATIVLQEQLREIARQLSIARQQCSLKDRPLCYTLQYSGFDVSYMTDNYSNDSKIKQLHQMDMEKKFNMSIEFAHKAFVEVPERVSLQVAQSISDIKTLLSRRRTEVYKSTHELDILTRSLSESVSKSEEIISSSVAKIDDWNTWQWLTVLGIASILGLIWGLLLCGVPCGCGLSSRTVPFLISGIGLSSAVCLVVWSLGTMTFLLGGHGQSLLCQPLYDTPHYTALANTLNTEGIFFAGGGFFYHFNNKANDTLRIEQVLKDCQHDQPVYTTFHLHNHLNVDKVTNYKTWKDFELILKNLSFSNNINLEILRPSLQINLQVLASLTTINLTSHREQVSGPITRRDLGSFADQLNSVARQLIDPISSRKIDNVAFLVRRVVNTDMNKLNEIRKRIIYKITLLEVLLQPLNKQTNQSLAHLKTIQFFIDNNGWKIADKVTSAFISRIETNLQELYNNVNLKVTKEIGKCRPLWEIFHSIRFYVCKLIVDPMNAIAFSCFFLILLFLIISPVVLKLVDYYQESNEDILSSISHRRSRDGLIIDDEGTWATPSSTPPDPTAIVSSPVEPQTWVTPRQPSETLIPPPPIRPPSISSRIPSPRMPQLPSLPSIRAPKSKLSSIAARLTSTRIPQMPSVSRARSPKRSRNESLRLIEPICWKTGSTTPRSWL